jgi:hypothetical protein
MKRITIVLEELDDEVRGVAYADGLEEARIRHSLNSLDTAEEAEIRTSHSLAQMAGSLVMFLREQAKSEESKIIKPSAFEKSLVKK